MPIYEYECLKCKNKFSELILEKEEEKKLRCPKCSAKKLEKLFSTFSVKTSSSAESMPNFPPGFVPGGGPGTGVVPPGFSPHPAMGMGPGMMAPPPGAHGYVPGHPEVEPGVDEDFEPSPTGWEELGNV